MKTPNRWTTDQLLIAMLCGVGIGFLIMNYAPRVLNLDCQAKIVEVAKQ